MAKAGYAVETTAAVALSAATARTVLAVLAPAQFGVDLRGLMVAFDGVSAANTPVLVEVCSLTGATNSTPGTNNTNENAAIDQIYGRSVTTGFTAFSACTTEPTVLSVIRPYLLTPNGGTLDFDWPFGETPDSAVSQGFAIRCNAPQAVNVRAAMRFERC